MGPSALELARKRCEELPAYLEKCREALSISGIDTPIDIGCPITHEMMVDPVVASDGHSYEREALMEILGDLGRSWEHTKLSPLTRAGRARNPEAHASQANPLLRGGDLEAHRRSSTKRQEPRHRARLTAALLRQACERLLLVSPDASESRQSRHPCHTESRQSRHRTRPSPAQ